MTTRRTCLLLPLALACWPLLVTGQPSQPSQPAQAAPAHIQTFLPGARLAGQGGYTWFGLAIYDAQLWLGKDGFDPGFSQPLVLDLRYARKLDGKKIAQASYDEMKKLGRGSEAQRQLWLQKMSAIFPDVREGTHISGAYSPTSGAQFFLNGAPLATVTDQEFARAFFAIWLDPNTSASKLRSALLRDATAQ